ncbi:MAG TPA: ABC transporter ATP-binding protein [Alphaproteobacteria bacterium]|nr:ABC transporter ATP-binding protein [Alphaproteobacteria bacterium]
MPSIPRTAELAADASQPLLAVEGLSVEFATLDGTLRAVDNASFALRAGETLGVVGESGSGKTQMFLGIMGLLAANGRVAGSAKFRGAELVGLETQALNRVRGSRIAFVFQDPMTALNPYLTIGTQLAEVLVAHKGMGWRDARAESARMLDRVRIPDAKRRLASYPHELSGGQRQRAMIAMALLCAPELLIADEPTTALDVTIQAEILALLAELIRDARMAAILVSHDLGAVAGLADRVVVMYGGRIVEDGPVDDIFASPRHPYTVGLLRSTPRLDELRVDALIGIPGQPPSLRHLPPGCAFAPRCERVFELCRTERPELRQAGPGRRKACHLEET